MKEEMKLLIALQDVDARMDLILTQKQEGPKKIKRLEQRLVELEARLTEEKAQMEAVIRERRETERTIDDLDNKLKKANIKLSSIKSNKEYLAALKEIDDLKHNKFILEEKVISIMEQMEALETSCAASREKAGEMRREFEMDRDAVISSLKALDHDLRAVEQERGSLAMAVDPGLLKRYDTLRERKGGIAVSPVVHGVCQTCHMRIPPQEFNELIRGDKLMTCPNCSRMIYWREEDKVQDKESEHVSEQDK